MMRSKKILLYCMLLIITGCSKPQQQPTILPTISLPSETPFPPTATHTPLPTSTHTPAATETPVPSPTPTPAVLIGAGDIAFCGSEPPYDGDEQTAAIILGLLEQEPHAVVFTSGDTVYGDGTMTELKKCFSPSWGQFKDRIRPSPGNHDYQTDQGAPYYAYFGAAAGEPGLGYYSYDLGEWHIVAMNSVCTDIACGSDSRQVQWLIEDLQASNSKCTLMYWHHPRFSSGLAAGTSAVSAFWRTAYEMGADVVVNGHDHNYERFAPLDAGGNADTNGIQLFIVGTGGAVLREMGAIRDHSEVRYSGTNGVIAFRLFPGQYEWQFIPADDPALTDTGVGICH